MTFNINGPEFVLLRHSTTDNSDLLDLLLDTVAQSGVEPADGASALESSLTRRKDLTGNDPSELDVATLGLAWCWVRQVLPWPEKAKSDYSEYMERIRRELLDGVSLRNDAVQMRVVTHFFTDWFIGLPSSGVSFVLNRQQVFEQGGTHTIINADLLPPDLRPPFGGSVFPPHSGSQFGDWTRGPSTEGGAGYVRPGAFA